MYFSQSWDGIFHFVYFLYIHTWYTHKFPSTCLVVVCTTTHFLHFFSNLEVQQVSLFTFENIVFLIAVFFPTFCMYISSFIEFFAVLLSFFLQDCSSRRLLRGYVTKKDFFFNPHYVCLFFITRVFSSFIVFCCFYELFGRLFQKKVLEEGWG